MPADLRVELFPADLDRAIAFYTALGFELRSRDDGPPAYAFVVRDAVKLGLVQSEPVPVEQRHTPAGAELVVEVDDVRAERDRAVAAGLDLAEDLQRRPWGLSDFRLHDPDGYYLRLTSRD